MTMIHPKISTFIAHTTMLYVKRFQTDAVHDMDHIWKNREKDQFYFIGFREAGTYLSSRRGESIKNFREFYPSKCKAIFALDVLDGKIVDVTHVNERNEHQDARYFILNGEAEKW